MAQKYAAGNKYYDNLYIYDDCKYRNDDDWHDEGDEDFDFPEVAAEIHKTYSTSEEKMQKEVSFPPIFDMLRDKFSSTTEVKGRHTHRIRSNMNSEQLKLVKHNCSSPHSDPISTTKQCKKTSKPIDYLNENPRQIPSSNQTSDIKNQPQTVLKDNVDMIKDNEIKSCATCSNIYQVFDVTSLTKGQHISMPGGLEKLGKAYRHHAIVIEIKKIDNEKVEMVLIHFKRDNLKFTLCKETVSYDKQNILDDFRIVQYKYPHEPKTIIERAEQTVEKKDDFEKYNLLTANCEHFATWCAVGKSQSFQVQSLQKQTANVVLIFYGKKSKTARCIKRLLLLPEYDLSLAFNTAAPAYNFKKHMAAYLIYSIFMTALYIRHYNQNNLCRSCLTNELLDIWLTFVAVETITLTSLIVEFAVPFLAPEVVFPMVILEILLSASFHITVPRLREALRSPFSIECKKVTDLEKINCGDILSIRYYGLHVKGIVTSYTFTGTTKSSEIEIVYYGVQSLYRTIVNNTFTIDKESKIYLYDFKLFTTYQNVVDRAKSRIGETKWNMFSNRNDHFLYWAKCKKNICAITPSAQASLFIEEMDIHSAEDLNKGDVIKSNVIGKISDTGILYSIDSTKKRAFDFRVYKLSFMGKVFLENCKIDLNKDTLCVKVYRLCQDKEQHVINAAESVTKGFRYLKTGRFIEHCIKKTQDVQQAGQDEIP